jgi:hypothetical protein
MKILAVFFVCFMGILGSVIKVPEEDPAEICKKVLEFPSWDSVFVNPVFFCKDSLGNYFYYSLLQTSVCNDTLCQFVSLNIYWDLAGHYTYFDTLAGKPLTKYDHMPFTTLDYLKLQITLSEENSILGEKTRDELLDKYLTRYSEKIDAVTGATAREIRSAVVEGALYSTYTLWHLVNGEINETMRRYTILNYGDEIESQLLNSKNPKTIIFGLKNLDEGYYFDHFEEILKIMHRGSPLVNFYIAKKMPPDALLIEKNRKYLLQMWDQFDRNTQSVIERYLNP